MNFLFGKRKEKVKNEVISISGVQLCALLKKAVLLAKEDVDTNCYTTGPEIMFEYNDKLHFCGIIYDKKRHRKEKRESFASELLNVYVDEQYFDTVNDLCSNAVIDGQVLSGVDGIIVTPEYKQLL